ncbi:hypothetical protein B0H16DRAFT_373901 [Mycena metata]|uniref:Uncharacterized protein n=1 Tax=Mycena metata TaxID=1033252 RepID=A0AAD7NM09_9AGAR|nr:hypothetical protein B0H16DRAFT_373901 [Mycena metata]
MSHIVDWPFRALLCCLLCAGLQPSLKLSQNGALRHLPRYFHAEPVRSNILTSTEGLSELLGSYLFLLQIPLW